MRKFKSLVVGLALAVDSFCYAGSSGYHGEAGETVHKIEDILLANNICKVTRIWEGGFKQNDCTEKQIVFAAPGYDGFGVMTYGITNKKVLQQIVALLKSEYARYGGKVRISFTASRSTWSEQYNRGLFGNIWLKYFGNDVLMKVKFERKTK